MMFDNEKWDKEMWSLDYEMARYILPKLLYYKNWIHHYGYSAEFYVYDDDMNIVDSLVYEWEEILDDIIWAFMYMVNDGSWVAQENWMDQAHIYDARVTRGLKLFGHFYQNFWT